MTVKRLRLGFRGKGARGSDPILDAKKGKSSESSHGELKRSWRKEGKKRKQGGHAYAEKRSKCSEKSDSGEEHCPLKRGQNIGGLYLFAFSDCVNNEGCLGTPSRGGKFTKEGGRTKDTGCRPKNLRGKGERNGERKGSLREWRFDGKTVKSISGPFTTACW